MFNTGPNFSNFQNQYIPSISYSDSNYYNQANPNASNQFNPQLSKAPNIQITLPNANQPNIPLASSSIFRPYQSYCYPSYHPNTLAQQYNQITTGSNFFLNNQTNANIYNNIAVSPTAGNQIGLNSQSLPYISTSNSNMIVVSPTHGSSNQIQMANVPIQVVSPSHNLFPQTIHTFPQSHLSSNMIEGSPDKNQPRSTLTSPMNISSTLIQ